MCVFLPQPLSAAESGLYPTHPHPQLCKKLKIKLKIKLKYRKAFLGNARCLSASPAHSLKPLRPEVLIMQILGHLLEVLHVGPNPDKHAATYSDTRGQWSRLTLAWCRWPTPVRNIVSNSYTSMVRSLRKSLCSGFSTSTTPQGYSRPLIFFPFTSIS